MTMALKAYLYSGQYADGYKFIENEKLFQDVFKVSHPILYYATLVSLRNNKDKQVLPVLKHLMDSDSDYKLQAMYLNYN